MKIEWIKFKSICEAKDIFIQMDENDYRYSLSAIDASISYSCSFLKESPPSLEQADFENNFKASVNKKIGAQLDTDGAHVVNPKLANSGRHYHSVFASFTVGAPSSLIAKLSDNSNNSEFEIKCFKADNSEVTTASSDADKLLVVKTAVNWAPTKSYDIQGFCIYQKLQPDTNMFLNAIAAYLIPAEYGGSLVAILGCNLKYAPYGNREVDWVGDSATSVPYDPLYFSHEQQIIIHHDVGTFHDIMCEIILYV